MDENKNKNVFVKLAGVINDFFKFWKTPASHNMVSNREIVAFAGGGMGVKMVNAMAVYIQLTATCVLLGSVYGLSPKNLFILALISNIVTIIKTPLASWLVDNTNTRWGKLRPYFLFAGIPCLIGVFGVCFLVPVNGTNLQKMISIGVFYNIYAVSQQLYNNAYTSLYQVISPNTGERNKIMSICELIANLGPSIIQLFLPLFAGLFFEGGLLNLNAYRVLLPIFTGIGFVCGLVVMFYTKERVILPRNSKKRVKFFEGLKLMSKNGDIWIVAVSRFFNGFRGSLTLLLTWICLYQIVDHGSELSGLYITIVSVGCTPGMILAPLLMKKLGSSKAAFVSFMLNAVAAAIMLFTFKYNAIFFVICLFLFNFANGPQFIIQTSITADALDEIQYKTDERIEGFVQNFQLMIEVLGTLASQFTFMMIYEHYGLKEGADGLTDYSILYDAAVREPIITAVIITVIVASIISALPYLAIKMTRSKHEEIILALKEKAESDNLKDENETLLDIKTCD